MINRDGYVNSVLGIGDKQTDVQENWGYQISPSEWIDIITAGMLYVGSRLVQKIINAPANLATQKWLKVENDEDKLILDMLGTLHAKKHFCYALRWGRLYGGAGIMMMINDGGMINQPVNVNNIEVIEGLRVFDRTEIFWDWSSTYQDATNENYGRPEYYNIIPSTGAAPFYVHESRMLIFENDELPNRWKAANMYWGMSALQGIVDTVRKYDHSVKNADLALERMAQTVHKIKDLASTLETEGGEELIRKQIALNDLCRSMRNTLVIDAEDDYQTQNLTLTNVKDIVEVMQINVCAMADIPATVLFGKSPDGMNATGAGDLENYYNMVEGIQEAYEPNLHRLIRLLQLQKTGSTGGEEIEGWKIEFNPLWNMSDKEQSDIDNKNADTEYKKAQERKMYVDSSLLDRVELRKAIEADGKYEIDHQFDELELPDENIPQTEVAIPGKRRARVPAV